MVKRASFYVVFVFLVSAFMTAGCAKQDVVKKDEGILPAQVAKPVEQSKSIQPKTSVAAPKQAATLPVTQAASAQQPQKTSSIAELQSALERIYFNFDSATLSDSSRGILAKNAAALAKETSSQIRIEGNCDERGSAEYNLALGERRAKAAQQYLVTMGVKQDRLSIISYGKEKPAVQGNDEAAWSKNRRDEFVVVTK
ncbi:MAG: peptidoglycan-associated lipoprotein Pal [Pelobacteraceae bacterium]